MHKYLILISRAFIASISYRAEIALWMIMDAMPVVVLCMVWTAIYANTTILNGLTLSEVITYYFLILIISNSTGSTFEKERVKEIREGKLDYYLTRPLHYVAEIFCTALGYRLFYVMVSMPIICSIFVVAQTSMGLELPTITLPSLIQFLFLVLFGYLVEFCCGMIAVLLGFWIEGADGLEHFKWIIITLLSGYMVPLEFMPAWLRSVTEFLPFKYMYAVPISIIQRNTILSIGDVSYILVTLGIFATIVGILYNYAKKAYSSYGG